MIFTSIEFFAFIAAVLLVMRFSKREEDRRLVLVFASYFFYAWWDWRFCFLLLASTTVDHYVGLRIAEAHAKTIRRRWLILSLCANLGVLGFFKYMNFFMDSFREAFLVAGIRMPEHLDIILPVGISFFTFQTMSYTIDVYRGVLPPTRSFRDFALFVSFFPQLVAGPIVRGSTFLPQLGTVHPLRMENVRAGAQLFLRGFLKKALFADTLGIYVDPIYQNPELYSSGTCWMATFAYAAQIYYDFSGYTDMAIGVARALGFELPENFRHPYLSRNISDFWRRWHISLSTWLRDYLYISAGGNRLGATRTYFNLMLTMFLGGLWHGASWNFVAWGVLHGLALGIHRAWRGDARKQVEGGFVQQVGSWALTFLFVSLCWVFFRAENFDITLAVLKKLAFMDAGGIDWFYVQAMVVLAVAALLHLLVLARKEKPLEIEIHGPVRWGLFVAFLAVLLYIMPTGPAPFIYFQF